MLPDPGCDLRETDETSPGFSWPSRSCDFLLPMGPGPPEPGSQDLPAGRVGEAFRQRQLPHRRAAGWSDSYRFQLWGEESGFCDLTQGKRILVSVATLREKRSRRASESQCFYYPSCVFQVRVHTCHVPHHKVLFFAPQQV